MPSAIWIKFNELPAGNCSTWDHHHITPFRSTTIRNHILIVTYTITGSSSLSPTPHQTRAAWYIYICKRRSRSRGAQSCRVFGSPKSELGSLWLTSSTCSASSPASPLGIRCAGPCPIHHSISPLSRSFSANLKRHIYRCFKCGSYGNQLDLYASSTGLSLFEATIELCEKLHREVPWMLNGTSPQPRPADRVAPQPRHDRGPRRRAGSVPDESDQTDRAATAPLVLTGLPKWYPF